MHIHIHHHSDSDMDCEILERLDRIIELLEGAKGIDPKELNPLMEKLNAIIADIKTTI